MERRSDVVVYGTHEAGGKIGGIANVLNGLISSPDYAQAVQRTIVCGYYPLHDAEARRRLAEQPGFVCHYVAGPSAAVTGFSTGDHLRQPVEAAVRKVAEEYQATVLVGERRFGAANSEIVLVDAGRDNQERHQPMKVFMFNRFRIDSSRYDRWNDSFSREYLQHLNAAMPLWRIVEALTIADGPRRWLIAHDWVGMFLYFAYCRSASPHYRSLYYAHEMPTARLACEGWLDSGYGLDTWYYNNLRAAARRGQFWDETFGARTDIYRHALMRRMTHMDGAVAVSQAVIEELRFLGEEFAPDRFPVWLAPNGVNPWIAETVIPERKIARDRLGAMCEGLYGYRPDVIMTQVSRAVRSKGIWRGVGTFQEYARLCKRAGRSALLIILATARQAPVSIERLRHWRSEFQWPVHHRLPPRRRDSGKELDKADLVDHEIDIMEEIDRFDLVCQREGIERCKVLFVNQFGWGGDPCGKWMPEGSCLRDLRLGTDVEFALSAYEPYGVAPLEALTGGALLALSSVCGALPFLRDAGGIEHLVVGDFVSLPNKYATIPPGHIDATIRHKIEDAQYATLAAAIDRWLEDNPDPDLRIRRGAAIAQRMSWNNRVRDYILPLLG